MNTKIILISLIIIVIAIVYFYMSKDKVENTENPTTFQSTDLAQPPVFPN